MNFHKKIGFLAALLLMFGLGVPDSFAQGTISLSVDPQKVTENGGSQVVTVTATITQTVATQLTAAVTVTHINTDGTETPISNQVSITIAANATSGNVEVNLDANNSPISDDDATDNMITITGGIGSISATSTSLTVEDDDIPITLTLNPTSLDESDSEQNVAVNVTLGAAAPATPTVGVLVDVSATGLSGINAIVVTVAATETTGTGTLSIPSTEDADAEDITITVTASHSNYVGDMETLTVIDDETQTYTLTLSETSVMEGASSTITATVTMAPSPTAVVEVLVTAGGQSSSVSVETDGDGEAEITIIPVSDDDDVDGSMTFTATLVSTGEVVDTADLTVTDDDKTEVLTLSLSPATLTEGTTNNQVTVTASLVYKVTSITQVTVTANVGGGAITQIGQIAIGSNESNDIELTITPINDVDGDNETITVTGTSGSLTNTADLTVLDDDGLSLTLGTNMLQEMDSAQDVAVTVTLTIAPDADTDVVVSGASASTTVTVNADATTGTGMLSIVTADADANDNLHIVTASADGYADGTTGLAVIDDDKSITLTTTTTSVEEGETTPVSVDWTLDPAGSATSPVTLTITPSPSANGDPVTIEATAGSGTATLSLSPPEDANATNETITLTAAATGYASGSATVTVTDDEATGTKITITTNPKEIRESDRARDVEVTATLSAAPGAGNTVVVALATIGSTPEASGAITVSGTDTSGKATLSIVSGEDNVYNVQTITVTGRADGHVSGSATISVRDNDATVGEIEISAAPPSVSVGSGSNTVTLTIDVIGQVDTPAGTQVTVTLATEGGSLSTTKVTVTLGKHPNQEKQTYRTQTNDGGGVGTRGTATLMVDAGSTAGVVATVTATADGYTEAKRTISALGRDAQDVHGYRVLITKPGANGWAGTGDKKVIVEVVRVEGIGLAWTAFGEIEVSLFDTTTVWNKTNIGETEVSTSISVSNITDDNGAISFTVNNAGVTGSKGKISYVAASDRLKFEVGIPKDVGPAPSGQYLNVYAAADFAIGNSTTRLTNRQADKPVYPNPAILASLVPNEADRYVGDGKFILVDNVKPGNAAIAVPVVTTGKEKGSDIKATVGDNISVAIGVNVGSGRDRFDINKVQVQLITLAGTAYSPDYMKGRMTVPSKTRNVKTLKNFTALEVVNASASGDSLYTSVEVKQGLFKSQTSKFVEGIGKIDTPFEGDGLEARVRARVLDQAGNTSGWRQSAIFDADSRLPKVSILYPSAMPDSMYGHAHPMRFTGRIEDTVQGQDVDAHLNPLVIKVDEQLKSLKVFAVGADTLTLVEPLSASGDSIAYNTQALSSPKKDGEGDDDKYPKTDYVPSSANRAGTEIELVVLATDMVGNTTQMPLPGVVTHDASRPVITDWFPTNTLIKPDNQINDATPPIFTLKEDVDSIAITYASSSGNVTRSSGGATKGEHSFKTQFVGQLKDDVPYTMTIFVRDLAGNVFITDPELSKNMTFNAQFANPVATRYKITTETDSVIAGQANILTIQAEDHDAGTNTTRNALTYKNAARIKAVDASGNVVASVSFDGAGVTDNAGGMAMLSLADWSIGKRTVEVKSNMATGSFKVAVEHLNSGQGGTDVVAFSSDTDVYVGAADFAGFDITAWENGVATTEILGDYTLRVVPVDRHGNASVRAFKSAPKTAKDSLNVLDTRVGGDPGAFEYKNGIDVEIVGVPTIEDFALLTLTIPKEGAEYDLVAPDNRRGQTVQVRVENESLKDGDTRSQNVRTTERFDIVAQPVLTLWVPGSDTDQAGNDVVVPADGITVTVAAEGYGAGAMVTFTKNGTAMDPVAANDDGVASLDIAMDAAGTVTVSATDGRFSTGDLKVVFTAPAAPTRKSYVDASGQPVYLIASGDMTVGVDDFLAFVAAYGSSAGDDNYNLQADVDDDGDVDVNDFLAFVSSYGRTATGPATKPLVLLPGINENAEFSLSLGSERVVYGELVAVDVSLANVEALVGYGFALTYEADKFEFVSVAPADEDLLKSTGGETLFHHVVADGQITVANGLYNGTAVSGGGDVVRFVFRVLHEFEDIARFEIADGLVFDPSQLQNPAVVAGVLELQSTPREFALHQNFPNPFNPDTTIKYDLAESADVTLQIYNVLGQVVRTLVASEAQNAGRYQIRWNGMDDRGVPVSSGIYFYQIAAEGKFHDVRKLMLLK